MDAASTGRRGCSLNTSALLALDRSPQDVGLPGGGAEHHTTERPDERRADDPSPPARHRVRPAQPGLDECDQQESADQPGQGELADPRFQRRPVLRFGRGGKAEQQAEPRGAGDDPDRREDPPGRHQGAERDPQQRGGQRLDAVIERGLDQPPAGEVIAADVDGRPQRRRHGDHRRRERGRGHEPIAPADGRRRRVGHRISVSRNVVPGRP
jgi:hypothetical protein